MPGFKKSADFFAEESAEAKSRQDRIEKLAGKKPSRTVAPPDDKLVQLSIYVPASYRKRARLAALEEGRSVSDAVRCFLEQWFDEVGV